MTFSSYPKVKQSSPDRVLLHPAQNQKATKQPITKLVFPTNTNNKTIPYEKLALIAELLK